MTQKGIRLSLALIGYLLLAVTVANAEDVSALMNVKSVVITQAQAHEKICMYGSDGDFDQATSCAMIEAAAGGDSDEILNYPRTYGGTPQKIYYYLESLGIIVETENYE